MVVLLGWFVTSCTSAADSTWQYSVAPTRAACTVRVVNHNFQDVDVFVLAGKTRMRLERVMAGDMVRVDVPLDVAGARPRLLVRQVGAGVYYATNDEYCEAGQEIELWIASDLNRSTLVNW